MGMGYRLEWKACLRTAGFSEQELLVIVQSMQNPAGLFLKISNQHLSLFNFITESKSETHCSQVICFSLKLLNNLQHAMMQLESNCPFLEALNEHPRVNFSRRLLFIFFKLVRARL